MRTIKHQDLAILSRAILVERYKRLRMKATGGSMAPFINDGDIVEIIAHEPDSLKSGDIIYFQRDESLIIHRVIKRFHFENGLFFITKGDANNGCDEPVGADRVLGKIISVQKQKFRLPLDNQISRIGSLAAVKLIAALKMLIENLYRLKKAMWGERQLIKLAPIADRLINIFPRIVAGFAKTLIKDQRDEH